MPSENNREDVQLEFWEHLDEVRNRIIRCLIVLAIVVSGVYFFFRTNCSFSRTTAS